MAIHAATHYGCKVTTTTISQEQYEYARDKVAAAGLQEQVEVLCRDYRELQGQYDKLVSIEMVEAVGKKLGLEDKDEEGVSKERKLKRALVAGLLAGLGASVASRLLGPRGLRLTFHF